MQQVHPELWREFFVTQGTAAAALVGLLFVANSLHVDKLRTDALLHRRARNVLLVLMLLFLQSLAVLIPQEPIPLAAEIAVLNILMAYFPISVVATMLRQKIPLPVTRIGPGILCPIAAVIGAVMLVMDMKWSLHIVAISNAVAIFVLVANAWSMMLGAWRTDSLKPARKKSLGPNR